MPQSTTMQPMAASVCTRDLGVLELARPDGLEAGALDFVDDLIESDALEIVRVKGGCREQKREAPEIVHVCP